MANSKNLNPPKNFRVITPRCCATCKWMAVDESRIHNIVFGCLRDLDSWSSDSLHDFHFTVCDYWQLSETAEYPVNVNGLFWKKDN